MPDRLTSLDPVIAQYTNFASEERLLWAFSEEARPQVEAQVDRYVAWLGLAPPARLLDLACGTGCHGIALARRGFRVTGLDCTPRMLDIAMRQSAQAGVSADWVLGDMRTLDYEGEFDAVMLRDVVFGIFPHPENLAVLEGVARAVKPGGPCLLEVYTFEFARLHGMEHCYHYDEASGRFQPRPEFGHLVSMQLYTEPQWREMLAAVGLAVERWEGWNWRRDPDPPPYRGVNIVARKV